MFIPILIVTVMCIGLHWDVHLMEGEKIDHSKSVRMMSDFMRNRITRDQKLR